MKKHKIIPPFLLALFLLLCPVMILNQEDDINYLFEINNAVIDDLHPYTESQAIEALIRIMAGDLTETSIRIANCESKMGKCKKNLQGSSAYGLFQFIDKTWNNYCQGDRDNNYDQIRCFLELYPKYPSWWVCQ